MYSRTLRRIKKWRKLTLAYNSSTQNYVSPNEASSQYLKGNKSIN
jgi:hypothetical protein